MKWILIIFLTGCLRLMADDAELTKQKGQIERAHSEISAVRAKFKSALQTALSKNPPEKAVSECRIDASKLSAENANFSVGRTSHKLRNPKNAPKEWMKPHLEKYVGSPRADHQSSVLVPIGGGKIGYLEPIYVEPLCLNCHGESVPKPVKAQLKKDYPDDKAIGFKVGDFRGFIWAEFEE